MKSQMLHHQLVYRYMMTETVTQKSNSVTSITLPFRWHKDSKMMNLMYVLNASFTEGRQQEVEHDKENIYQQKQRL